MKEYRLALERQPGAADVMFDYAYALVRERKLEETLTWLTRGLNHGPMALFSGMHPAVINVVLRNWTQALRWADLYISCQPRDPWGYYEKAYVLIDSFGDLDRARTVLMMNQNTPPARHGVPHSRHGPCLAGSEERSSCGAGKVPGSDAAEIRPVAAQRTARGTTR